MKSVDVKSNTYTDFNKENNEEDPKFKFGDHVNISKYKSVFAKGYVANWSEKVFVIRKVKNAMSWKCVISDFNSEEIVGLFYKKNYEKQFKRSIELKM